MSAFSTGTTFNMVEVTSISDTTITPPHHGSMVSEDQGTLPGLTRKDLACPVCFNTICDPFATSCGHTFCYACLVTHLKHRNSCPSCGSYITQDHIFPNFLLNKVSARHSPCTRTATSLSVNYGQLYSTANGLGQVHTAQVSGFISCYFFQL